MDHNTQITQHNKSHYKKMINNKTHYVQIDDTFYIHKIQIILITNPPSSSDCDLLVKEHNIVNNTQTVEFFL